MSDTSDDGIRLGSIVSIVFGIVAVGIGVADILGYIGSSPPAYLIVVGLLLVMTEYENVRGVYAGSD